LPLRCEVVEKGYWAPVCRGIPQISDIHYQIVLTSEHVARCGWVWFSELGGYSWRKKDRSRFDRRIAV